MTIEDRLSTQPKALLTPEQYLEIERKAEFKSEYYKGEMFATSGASLAHNRIASRLIQTLGVQLRGRDCEPLSGDMRVFIPATGLYTYPDVVVVCGQPKLQEQSFDTLLNPTVLVEILSPSTEAYDRGRKFEHRSLESVQEYVLVASDRVQIDVYTRLPEGKWILGSAGSMDAVVQLQSIDCRLSLAELYERIDLTNAG